MWSSILGKISSIGIPEWLNFGMLLVTTIYVVLTRGILRQTRASVNELIQQRADRDRPRVVVFPAIIPGSKLISLEIANIGQKAAENLKINLDKDIYRWSHKNDSSHLNSLPAFSVPIAYFNVGQRLIFEFDTISYLNDESRPKIFGIELEYTSEGQTYTEAQKVDFCPLVNSSFVNHPLHGDFEKLNKILEARLK